MTVGELERRISERELSEWMAYYQIEPWGEERADLRSGIVASTIANVHRGKGKPAFTPEDFMPRYGTGDEPDHIAEQIEEVMSQFLS